MERVTTRTDAELDVVAELFAQAWCSRRRFGDPGDGAAGAWLYGICRHLIARYHRRGRADNSARRRLRMDVDHSGASLEVAKSSEPSAVE